MVTFYVYQPLRHSVSKPIILHFPILKSLHLQTFAQIRFVLCFWSPHRRRKFVSDFFDGFAHLSLDWGWLPKKDKSGARAGCVAANLSLISLKEIHLEISNKYTAKFETNTLQNLRQIHPRREKAGGRSLSWLRPKPICPRFLWRSLNKYIFKFETNTFLNLRQIHF